MSRRERRLLAPSPPAGVIYLSGHSCSGCQAVAARRADLGLIVQPGNSYGGVIERYAAWAADNGCFAATWAEESWRRWLATFSPAGALFAVVPDVVGDPVGTAARWRFYAPPVRRLGFPCAYVVQDGASVARVPWAEVDVVFVGGSPATTWKTGPAAHTLVVEARRRGIRTHMGRVNTFRRLALAESWGIDSVDGTLLAKGCDTNLPILLRFLDRVQAAPALPLFREG